MVRERVGGWRLAWRFALAGLVAGILVMATAQTAVVAPLFYAPQDQLFPTPVPSPQVTLVALDSVSAASGIKLVDADGIYSQAVSFFHNQAFCPRSRPQCMVPNQNYGYRIMGDEISTALNDRYVRPQPDWSVFA